MIATENDVDNAGATNRRVEIRVGLAVDRTASSVNSFVRHRFDPSSAVVVDADGGCRQLGSPPSLQGLRETVDDRWLLTAVDVSSSSSSLFETSE